MKPHEIRKGRWYRCLLANGETRDRYVGAVIPGRCAGAEVVSSLVCGSGYTGMSIDKFAEWAVEDVTDERVGQCGWLNNPCPRDTI